MKWELKRALASEIGVSVRSSIRAWLLTTGWGLRGHWLLIGVEGLKESLVFDPRVGAQGSLCFYLGVGGLKGA